MYIYNILYYVVLCCVVYHVIHIMDDSLVYHVQSYWLHIYVYIYSMYTDTYYKQYIYMLYITHCLHIRASVGHLKIHPGSPRSPLGSPTPSRRTDGWHGESARRAWWRPAGLPWAAMVPKKWDLFMGLLSGENYGLWLEYHL